MQLSKAQQQAFRRDGYLILEGVFDQNDFGPVVAQLQDWVDRRARERFAAGKIKALYEELDFANRFARILVECPDAISGLDLMHSRLPAVFDFLRNRNLMETLSGLLGTEITCNPIQHLRAKPPTTESTRKIAELIDWHQDAGVTWEEADPSEIITCWIPLVDATRENGCMQLMPGCHTQGYLPHQEGASLVRASMPQVTPVTAEVKRGGMILMDKYTPHCSTPNLTQTIRWTLDLRFQRTGTPTGRPFFPDFVCHSEKNPGSVLTDHAEWSRRWIKALEESKGIKWHRTVPKDQRIPEHLRGQVQNAYQG